MDEAVARPPCAFERALLARCGECALASRRTVGERETVVCASGAARERCAAFVAALRERAAFPLGLAPAARWPHSASMRLACGGLAGLRACVGADDADDADVARALAAAESRFGGVAELPWARIVAEVKAWPVRHRSRP